MKIIRISKCGECPYCTYTHWGNICMKELTTYSYTVDLNTIPEWCPLEDEEVGE